MDNWPGLDNLIELARIGQLARIRQLARDHKIGMIILLLLLHPTRFKRISLTSLIEDNIFRNSLGISNWGLFMAKC